ncbi:MAG TPA: immunoglobulin domain-containing protein [Methylomirabilota bacterium]|nr:immunoglobulin domain-containing protein [Methylomirabilota bacterium]
MHSSRCISIHSTAACGKTPTSSSKLARLASLLLLTGVTLRVEAQTITVSNLWTLAAGSRAYVTAGATERGIAYNPLSNHVYVVSRAESTLRVAILDGDSGTELGFLNTTGVGGGTFALSCIDVADDGSIYAGNLSGGSTATPTYRLYRWVNESDPPTPLFVGNPGETDPGRWGDNLRVRGSGSGTQVLLGSGSGSSLASILTYTDDTLTAMTARRIVNTGIANSDLSKGVAFGIGDTYFGKNNGVANVRQLTFDLPAGTGALAANVPVEAGIGPIDVDPENNLLAGVNISNHRLVVYDISTPTAPALLAALPFPTPNVANGNGVGQVDIAGGRIYAVDTQNGIVAARIHIDTTPVPPVITTHPQNVTLVEGGFGSLSVAATGPRPFFYQWFFGDLPLVGATNSSLTLSNVTLAQAGTYSVVVSNAAGGVPSNPATVSVTPTVRSPTVLNPLWQLPAGSVPWLATDNTHRGLAYNPTTDHLLVVSRTPSNAIHVLDAATGAYLYNLNLEGVVPNATLPAINMIGVSDDGVILACNLTTDGTAAPLNIYSWGFEDSLLAPMTVFSGDPGNGLIGPARWGDSFDVRGEGIATQILLGTRSGTHAAILQTGDGVVFTSTPIQTDAAAGDFGLSVSFGSGDTFWGKASARPLRRIGFDLASGTGTTLALFSADSFPSGLSVIGVDAGNFLMAGIARENSDNVRLFSILNTPDQPLWLDTEFYPTDFPNDNATGAIDFGGGRLYALNSNNGIVAYSVTPPVVAPRLRYRIEGNRMILQWNGPATLLSSPTARGGYEPEVGAVSGFEVDLSRAAGRFYQLMK